MVKSDRSQLLLDQYFQNPSVEPTRLDWGDGMTSLFPELSNALDPYEYS